MSISAPFSRGVSGGNASAVTGSMMPAPGDVLLAIVYGRRNGSLPGVPTITDSLTGIWNVVGDQTYDPGNNPRIRARVFWQKIGPTPAPMTVTGAVPLATRMGVSVVSIAGCSTDFSNFKFGNNINGDPSCTLTFATAVDSMLFGWCVGPGANVITPAPGFVELFDAAVNANTRLEAAFALPALGQTMSWTSLNSNSIGFVTEVKIASGGTVVDVTSLPMPLALGDPIASGAATTSVTGLPSNMLMGQVEVNPLGPTGSGTAPSGLSLVLSL